MFKILSATITATVLTVGAAAASTVTGTWYVDAINIVGTDRAGSQATFENGVEAARKASMGTPGYTRDAFIYTGTLDFGTFDRQDGTTIAEWLATGTPGGVSGLDAAFGNLQLSAPNINNGTATTTLFGFFDEVGGYLAGTLNVTHDDGFTLIDAPTTGDGFPGPTGQRLTTVDFAGGELDFVYVATNGDPSVLRVDLAAVPLPAGLPLLLLGLGGMAALRRQKHAA